MYTGNTVEIADVGKPQEAYRLDIGTYTNKTVNNPAWADGGWSGSASGNNRLERQWEPTLVGPPPQQVYYKPAFRSQLIEGRIVLWAAADRIQAGKDQFAVVAEGVNLDHIWSSWRGQRWVNRANVDEGLMSFKDLVDFHKDEVFSTFSLSTDSLVWVDENTLDLSNNEWLTLGLNSNYSMSFTYADAPVIVRGGGDNQSFGNRLVVLNWVQYTDSDGEVTITEDGIESTELRVYDESNVYDRPQQTVVREELDYLTQGYGEGIVNFKIYHITVDDNIETGDIDEGVNYWQIRQETPAGSGVWSWLEPKYTNQLEADNALDEILAEYDRLSALGMVEVDARNAAAQAASDEARRAAAAAAAAAAAKKREEDKKKKDSWFSSIDKEDMKSLLFGGALVVLGVLLISVLMKKGGGENTEA
jgi:ribosomal protein L12E/L44/L45/RPP1/RPP2